MTARRQRRRPLVAIAMVCALVTLLSGCVGSFLPTATPRPTSTPTGETVDAALEPFYSQVLVWTSCEAGDYQCATAKAPLDWSDPGRASIDLALIRKAASGTPIGSLLVNPGGPGASGYDFIRDSLGTAVDSKLRDRFDIVGFDPRGVNHSSKVSCYTYPAELDAYLFGISPNPVGSDAWIADQRASNKAFGQACLAHTGELLGYVDTVSAARDLDMLRAVLGDKKLNYLGYSYGTLLGATYADLYPKKTGRLVLDGAVDPATTEFDVTSVQAQGFESALRAYLKDCLGRDGCPFRGTVEQSMASVGSLLRGLDTDPITASDGRKLGGGAMFNAIILPLYNAENWKLLDDLFTDVKAGSADYAMQLADAYYGRRGDGTYSDNSTEAFIAVNCLDYTSDSDVGAMRAKAAELAKLAPVFGPEMAYGGIGCADWPYPPTRTRGPITAEGSAPILVVGTTNDPATPYRWAKSLAGELANGHLLTYTGEGHTAYNKSSCVNKIVDAFLVDGAVPSGSPRC